MSTEIEKMLGRIFTTFEKHSVSQKKRRENNRVALLSLYEKVINPAMQAHLSVAEQQGFKVNTQKIIRQRSAKFIYKMFVNLNGTFIEVIFDAPAINPKIIISAQSSCKGRGKNFPGNEYPYNEITKQLIDEFVTQTLKVIAEL
jgi:hypothetical protein